MLIWSLLYQKRVVKMSDKEEEIIEKEKQIPLKEPDENEESSCREVGWSWITKSLINSHLRDVYLRR